MLNRTVPGLIVAILTGLSAVRAQGTTAPSGDYLFTKGLMVGHVQHYGREALVTDQLAYRLDKGEWQTPAEGITVYDDPGTGPVAWKKIDADSLGRFRSRELSGGYLYLTYQSPVNRLALLTITGNDMCYFNDEPHGGDIYGSGWMNLPVRLRKGHNELLIRCAPFGGGQGIRASLSFPDRSLLLNTADSTMPMVVIGRRNDSLWGAVVVINGGDRPVRGLELQAETGGEKQTTILPVIGPMTIRKVGFRFNAGSIHTSGDHSCALSLSTASGKKLDRREIILKAVGSSEHYSNSFISDIDGSVQYYSVSPSQRPEAASAGGTSPVNDAAASPPPGTVGPGHASSSRAQLSPAIAEPGPGTNALFLSVHGAGVEAIGQARAYRPKDWGVLVAATNRRPRGFNWEDWGRIDALEVLALAEKEFHPDPRHIYLTGHSMGGHGTWYLGATYPDKWAAIGACSGYPSLSDYGSHDGQIPTAGRSPLEDILLRASHPSDVLSLARNYTAMGVYVLHGDEDRVVPVKYARQMRDTLAAFQADFSYYERPGVGHWEGNESEDWGPLFDFLHWHILPIDSSVNRVDFTTADPGISSRFRWLEIAQQEHPLQFSRVQLKRTQRGHLVEGSTQNIALLSIAGEALHPGDTLSVVLDGQPVIRYRIQTTRDTVWLGKNSGQWRVSKGPDPVEKNPVRSGTFKDAFNHRMVFIYGTSGNAGENARSYEKARYDAETWYYRGNGAVDILPDNAFDPAAFPDRGLVIYGNASTNSAWAKVLSNCPIRVTRGSIRAGDRTWTGDSLSAYFVWPRPDSRFASIAVIAGTGGPGMMAALPNQYFAGGSGFPDYMIYTVDMLKNGIDGVKAAGFFTNGWQLDLTSGDAIARP
jgi:pimeloyl-ACP methyl ester carboxylesterase